MKYFSLTGTFSWRSTRRKRKCHWEYIGFLWPLHIKVLFASSLWWIRQCVYCRWHGTERTYQRSTYQNDFGLWYSFRNRRITSSNRRAWFVQSPLSCSAPAFTWKQHAFATALWQLNKADRYVCEIASHGDCTPRPFQKKASDPRSDPRATVGKVVLPWPILTE